MKFTKADWRQVLINAKGYLKLAIPFADDDAEFVALPQVHVLDATSPAKWPYNDVNLLYENYFVGDPAPTKWLQSTVDSLNLIENFFDPISIDFVDDLPTDLTEDVQSFGPFSPSDDLTFVVRPLGTNWMVFSVGGTPVFTSGSLAEYVQAIHGGPPDPTMWSTDETIGDPSFIEFEEFEGETTHGPYVSESTVRSYDLDIHRAPYDRGTTRIRIDYVDDLGGPRTTTFTSSFSFSLSPTTSITYGSYTFLSGIGSDEGQPLDVDIISGQGFDGAFFFPTNLSITSVQIELEIFKA